LSSAQQVARGAIGATDAMFNFLGGAVCDRLINRSGYSFPIALWNSGHNLLEGRLGLGQIKPKNSEQFFAKAIAPRARGSTGKSTTPPRGRFTNVLLKDPGRLDDMNMTWVRKYLAD
jgi:hypothetical protein